MFLEKRTLYSVILLLLVSVSCSPTSLYIDHPNPTATPSISARAIGKTRNFDWQESWRLRTRLLTNSQNVRNLVAVEDGVVFTDGFWLKFVSDKGDLQWSAKLEGWTDSIAVGEQLLYVVGDMGPIVNAFDLKTGKLVWKSFPLPGHTEYYLRFDESTLYAYERGNQVYTFDAQPGQFENSSHRWPTSDQETFSLLQLNDRDWLQSDGQKITRIGGEETIWQTNLGGFPQKFPEIWDNVLIIRIEEKDVPTFRSLVGVDLDTGHILWHRSGEFLSNFVTQDELLYVISRESNILTLDPESGQTVGEAEMLPNSVDAYHPISAIAVNEKMLYVYFFDSQELIAFEKAKEGL